ncbi:MAG: metallophosphoesterase [Thermonemataceae bacterium]
MKQLFIISFFLVLSFFFEATAQTPAKIIVESVEGATPWSSLEVNNKAENFQFAIVTDRTGGLRKGVFPEAVTKLNLLQPEFVMSVGDLISGYTEDEAQLDYEWKEFKGFIDNLKMPFFYVPGNHDITNKVMEQKWKENFGPTYYHFLYQDVLFLCLNSEDNIRGAGRGSIDDEQYEYIKKTLEANKEVRWTLVFMHQPLWMQTADGVDTKRWKDVEALLAERQHSVFVGHIHRYIKFQRNNGKYFTLATTGGGSSLRGARLGEFDHVVWVTMTDDGPILANLLLEGIWDEDVSTEAMSNYARPLANGFPIVVNPLLVNDTQFNKATTELKLTNDSDGLMEVNMKFVHNLHLTPNLGEQTVTVQPNSVEVIPLEISSTEALTLGKIDPLKMEAKITYKNDNLPELTFDKNLRLLPEKEHKVTKTDKKIKVDGTLKEWEEFDFTVQNSPFIDTDPFSHQGDKDGSFEFSLNYDEAFLYITTKVKDDEINVDKNRWADEQDAIYIVLDFRPENLSASNNGSWGDAAFFIHIPPTSKKVVNKELFFSRRIKENTQARTVLTDEGYQTELAIPIEYLKEKQGDNWQSFRLNIYQSDADQDFQHHSMIYWRPGWRNEDNYIGSGIFRRK